MNALVFGITGQKGSYMAELLLANRVEVIGVVRRTSTSNTSRIDHIKDKITLEDGDICDAGFISGIINKYKPTYCFNFAAQSFVATSFNQPSYTFEVNTVGTLNVLEAIRNFSVHTKFIHSSTSEMYGNNYNIKEEKIPCNTGVYIDGIKIEQFIDKIKYQDESTEFAPDSPYAVSKLAAHELVKLYRKAYKLFGANIISFNTESPRRGDEFVTKKITNYVKDWSSQGSLAPYTYPKLHLGNIKASRDWTHAKDIVQGYWKAINHTVADDFVLCSGETHTVEEFLTEAFGVYNYDWKQSVAINPALMRPVDVEYLRGDASKAKSVLGWSPTITFKELVKEMVEK